jgi:hypothetical protein
MLKDGHWRANTEDHEKAAWEESVRLREQMFWSRIGGGVVPAVPQPSEASKSPRGSQEQPRPSIDEALASSVPSAPATEPEPTGSPSPDEQSKRDDSTADARPVTPTPLEGGRSSRLSTQSADEKAAGAETSQRLSITIPSQE